MLCTIFLAEEMSVRKTVTALVSKTLQKCNCRWRTRIYERKQQSVGILVAHCLLSKILCRYEFPFSANYTRTAPPGARGGKLIRKRTAKWPFYRTATSLDYRLKTLSPQVATHQAQAGKSAPEQHRSRSAIRRSHWTAKFPD